MPTRPSTGRTPTRWAVLALTSVAGVAMALVMALRGDIMMAVLLPAISIGYGLTVTLSASRSDVAAQLSGHEEDERRQLINLRAAAMTGNVLVAALVCGVAYELARDELGGPFTVLSALGGFTYIVASAAYTRSGSASL
ncbi:hypothetical protein [Streptomyces hiroshimensis]|uniref:DUF2178 domain-containing protein n=1 Tax=Streptomyces hiroshimensis TaxID=66424 RepID=A0ABQ2YMC0_9ACTN|nr:hypothetical protein [Streptomyces hiroshimensis]GGX88455.1 hypothetical protein GCM10010324_37800 [Streptomyces hiroshimensis]